MPEHNIIACIELVAIASQNKTTCNSEIRNQLGNQKSKLRNQKSWWFEISYAIFKGVIPLASTVKVTAWWFHRISGLVSRQGIFTHCGAYNFQSISTCAKLKNTLIRGSSIYGYSISKTEILWSMGAYLSSYFLRLIDIFTPESYTNGPTEDLPVVCNTEHSLDLWNHRC